MRFPVFIALAIAVISCTCAEIRYDFEDGTLQGWKVLEGEFGQLIGSREFQFNKRTERYTQDGKYYLTTLEQPGGKHPSDRYMGIIESPLVCLTSPKISVKVGGGAHEAVGFSVHLENGQALGFARGENDEIMRVRVLDLPEAVGKRVYFRIFDEHEGSWGHVTVDSVVCEGEELAEESRARFAARTLELSRHSESRVTLESLRKGIESIWRCFPGEYPGEALLSELSSLGKDDDLREFSLRALVRMNPVVNSAPILFVTRKQFRVDHHNTATMFQTGEINTRSYDTSGCLKQLDVKTGLVTSVFAPGSSCTVRDPEVSFDGKQVVFSMRRGADDDYHVYTYELSTGKLVQLTRAKGVSDIDPLWLPDGDIAFTSTREPKYCMCNRHIMGNLYRMGPDGSNILQIGKSTLHEGHSSLLPDGRILYDRWEYVDRNFGDAQGLWTCNPDGTNHAVFWGNNTTSPGGVIDARALSHPNRVIAVLSSCHDRPWGALGIIDRSIDVDGRDPVLHTWPEDFRKKITVEGQSFDSTVSLKIKYEDPYPLDDGHFLCSRQVGRGELMGLYYLDLHGNEVLIHVEAPGCYDPMPLRARTRPPVLATRRNFEHQKAKGLVYLQDVYVGTHMKGVERGSVKYLRVVESPEKRNWTWGGWQGQGEQAPGMNWHSFENKRILGTVPVESDGSAYFELPANTFVYYQALDASGRMVQSMRSGTYVQPDEAQGCIGCHESRTASAELIVARPKAMGRAPSKLDGWLGEPRLFSYQREVQPVFNAKCIKCHDYGKPAAKKLNLSGDRDIVFCASYVDLWALGYVKCVGGGPAAIQEAGSWGSKVSKLPQVLEAGHKDVVLTDEEWARLRTWIDINAPYYPVYESAYPDNPGGRSPLTRDELKRIKELSGVEVSLSWGKRQRSQLNFDRPELSAILSARPEHREELLTLIRQGRDRLKAVPRGDMDGFVPCAKERKRELKYAERLSIEHQVYEAIKSGKKCFDKE